MSDFDETLQQARAAAEAAGLTPSDVEEGIERCRDKRMRLPQFRSEDEERAFWAEHDSTEYLDWSAGETALEDSLVDDPIEFEIERVLTIRGLTYVVARVLSDSEFAINPGSTLGGAAVGEFIAVPRAIAADGTLRTGLYSFVLLDPEMAGSLPPGARVELRSPRAV
jgi:hypothetical protein